MSRHRSTGKKKTLNTAMTVAELEEFFLREFLKLQRSKGKKERRLQSIDEPTPAEAWADGCEDCPAPRFVKPTIH